MFATFIAWGCEEKSLANAYQRGNAHQRNVRQRIALRRAVEDRLRFKAAQSGLIGFDAWQKLS